MNATMAIGQERAVGLKMPPMTGNRKGAPMRRMILLSLLDREPQTIRGLASNIGATYANTQEHLGRMERAGLVTIERRRGRLGSVVRLTEAGRTAARTV